MRPRTVCVTGGTGFLGSWCVKLLLERGYNVRATTRDADKAAYLRKLPKAETNLSIISGVELLAPGAFSSAFEDCDAVLHTASPYVLKGASRDELVAPAVEGTRSVLSTCSALGISKVVLTSSITSLNATYGSQPADHVYAEGDWLSEDFLESREAWYPLAKLLAEKAAWEASGQPGCPWQLAVMLPTQIFGPMLEGQPHLNTSSGAPSRDREGTIESPALAVPEPIKPYRLPQLLNRRGHAIASCADQVRWLPLSMAAFPSSPMRTSPASTCVMSPRRTCEP